MKTKEKKRVITSVKIRHNSTCPNCKKIFEETLCLNDSYDCDMQLGNIIQQMLDHGEVTLQSRGRSKVKMDNIVNVISRMNKKEVQITHAIVQDLNEKTGMTMDVHRAIIKIIN